jgi:hypothetical protein
VRREIPTTAPDVPKVNVGSDAGAALIDAASITPDPSGVDLTQHGSALDSSNPGIETPVNDSAVLSPLSTEIDTHIPTPENGHHTPLLSHPTIPDPARQRSPSLGHSTIVSEVLDSQLVQSATPFDAFANVSFVELWESAGGGQISTTTGVVDHDELDTWFANDQSSQLGSRRMRLMCVQSNAQEDAIYTKRKTFETIIAKLGVHSNLKMYQRNPLMGTYSFKIPLKKGEDGFVFHSQSAVTINESTILSYKFTSAANSIDAVILDTRPRIELYLASLKKVTPFVGNPALPLLALARLGLLSSKSDAALQSTLHYVPKKLFRNLINQRELDYNMAELSRASKDSLGTLGTVLTLQSHTTQDLIRTIRAEFESELSPDVTSFLSMILSINDGIERWNHRLGRRAKDSHSSRLEQTQLSISDQAQKTRDVMTKLDQGRNDMHEIMNSNLAQMKDVNDYMKDLTVAQSKSGSLLTALAVVTVPYLTGQTLSVSSPPHCALSIVSKHD